MSDGSTFTSSTGESPFDHLRVLTVIGESADAVVYLGEWITPLGGFVAVKRGRVMAPEGVPPPADASRLLDLDHPRIATVFDVGTDGSGRPYAVTEYVAGIGIARYCGTYDPAVRDRLELVLQAAETLEYAHARGVHHLNLKESNVLVAPGGGITLLDFHAAVPYRRATPVSDLISLGLLLSDVIAGAAALLEEDASLDAARRIARHALSSDAGGDLREFCRDLARVTG
jgi:serine/threonine protein kinase